MGATIMGATVLHELGRGDGRGHGLRAAGRGRGAENAGKGGIALLVVLCSILLVLLRVLLALLLPRGRNPITLVVGHGCFHDACVSHRMVYLRRPRPCDGQSTIERWAREGWNCNQKWRRDEPTRISVSTTARQRPSVLFSSVVVPQIFAQLLQKPDRVECRSGRYRGRLSLSSSSPSLGGSMERRPLLEIVSGCATGSG